MQLLQYIDWEGVGASILRGRDALKMEKVDDGSLPLELQKEAIESYNSLVDKYNSVFDLGDRTQASAIGEQIMNHRLKRMFFDHKRQ